MTFQVAKQALSTFLCVILIPLTLPADAAGLLGAQAQAQTTSTSAPAVAPLSDDQLDALVAPIALYPDALVAQVLAAAVYPDQVAFADDWLSQNSNLTGSALVQAVNQQSWDPSVKALSQFPTVLHNLAKNLSWTSNLGQAFSNQQSDVMAAVQVMRAKAQAAGTLKSTSQIKIVQQSPQTIVIEPASSQVVYVPQYNPAVVFGTPYVVPLYTPPVAVAAATVSFGAGVAIGAAFGGGGFVGGGFGGGVSWGFSSWGCSWGGGGGGGGGNVIYNHNTYINKTNINKNSNNNNTNYHPWNKNSNDGNNSANNRPNGGANGNHGLIGGQGGVQHNPQQRAVNDQHPGNDQRASNDQRPGDNQRFGNDQQRFGAQDARQRGGNAPGAARQRSNMSGNGNQARAQANRGRASMNRGGAERAVRGGGGGGGERGGGGARGRR
jgi:Protein of unknown function (DUF3300)